jgi:hypothetical protein
MKITEKIITFIEKKNKEISKILDHKKKYRIDFIKNGENKAISIFDKKKMVLNGEYNFYGIYQPQTKLWIWASSIPGVDIKHIKNIDKLKKMDHLFELNTDDVKVNFYYQLLTQDVLYITNSKMLNWINELLIYLTNDVYYFNPINSDGNIQFITLVKIKEKYN